jgi:hypothetical protein
MSRFWSRFDFADRIWQGAQALLRVAFSMTFRRDSFVNRNILVETLAMGGCARPEFLLQSR